MDLQSKALKQLSDAMQAEVEIALHKPEELGWFHSIPVEHTTAVRYLLLEAPEDTPLSTEQEALILMTAIATAYELLLRRYDEALGASSLRRPAPIILPPYSP